LKSRQLLRPSRLTQLWPRLVFLPPFILFSIKTLYSSRESLFALANDTQETLIKFVRGWLLEPLQDVIRTVRAGRDGGVIIRKEGIAADFAVGGFRSSGISQG
jgi:nuclear-control-of-ATPase protein 2